ncbi:MAG: LysR family transcriptional regulator [Desulfurivibrionaceae bacterium]|jgi:LysR family transcriptional regulator for metE and metH
MNHLEIKHLRMISAIAETGNMTKAAARLFISQSALSQQLKDIEGKLKVALFFRTRKVMLLTPVGKKLLESAQQVIQTLEDAELEIAKNVSGEQGELKVGVQCIFCYKWLPGVVRVFQKKFPNIEFEIGTSSDLATDLESKKFDCIITAASVPDDQYLCVPLFADQLVCIMAADHPLRARSWVRYEDFGKFNLISLTEKGASRFYQLVLKPRGLEPKRFMAVGQPQAIVEMVASDFGLGIFPRWAINDSLETTGITVRPISKSGLPVTWFAAFLKNSHLPVFQQEFVNIISKMKMEEWPDSLPKRA